jgi:dTDP-4-amino-4,6-dideoxygalactose transaminase
MSEIAAAMGITSLESLDDFIAANRERYDRYSQELQGVPGVKLAVYDPHGTYNYQYVVLELDEAVAGMTRDDLHRVLHAENVLARRYFYPGCHCMEPYRANPPSGGWDLPVTERIASRVLCLPTGPSLSRVDVQQICQIIRLAVTNGHAVRGRGVGRSSS